jgi:hypothetical protein
VHSVGLAHDGRRQIRREVIDSSNRFLDCGPSGHRVEARIADGMHRALRVHPLVQRRGVLDAIVVEELQPQRTVAQRHLSRFERGKQRVNPSARG